ncbi:MAG TPA: bifunctional hydroxymethylpyrimidine kinase/phosphomethylpyrimidine kinase, partial [Pyrinomonadaceae bacterium]|nr:bifunctional hydroxymethylpyrimidine kinase/phosphomethylpyrimidine kinase [Pyrinomonadaceae bacterium]
TVITPNIPEAERISGVAIENYEDIVAAADVMRGLGANAVLIKGGHQFEGERQKEKGETLATDYLFTAESVSEFSSPFVETKGTHGTGCVLSAAITANLAIGESLNEAIRIAKNFVAEALANPNHLGRGFHPVNI